MNRQCACVSYDTGEAASQPLAGIKLQSETNRRCDRGEGKGKPVDLTDGISSGLPSIGGDYNLTCRPGIGSAAMLTRDKFATWKVGFKSFKMEDTKASGTP
ncbi:hypothetical protein EN41_11385 [Agrobacterium tumefaciens]|nr:hypothetical protein EN41_11385 [Agrobacterium tumefaciens]